MLFNFLQEHPVEDYLSHMVIGTLEDPSHHNTTNYFKI